MATGPPLVVDWAAHRAPAHAIRRVIARICAWFPPYARLNHAHGPSARDGDDDFTSALASATFREEFNAAVVGGCFVNGKSHGKRLEGAARLSEALLLFPLLTPCRQGCFLCHGKPG